MSKHKEAIERLLHELDYARSNLRAAEDDILRHKDMLLRAQNAVPELKAKIEDMMGAIELLRKEGEK